MEGTVGKAWVPFHINCVSVVGHPRFSKRYFRTRRYNAKWVAVTSTSTHTHRPHIPTVSLEIPSCPVLSLLGQPSSHHPIRPRPYFSLLQNVMNRQFFELKHLRVCARRIDNTTHSNHVAPVGHFYLLSTAGSTICSGFALPYSLSLSLSCSFHLVVHPPHPHMIPFIYR